MEGLGAGAGEGWALAVTDQFAYRALLCGVPHLTPPAVAEAARWLRANLTDAVERMRRGDMSGIVGDWRERARREDLIALAALDELEHPEAWDISGGVIGDGDVMVVLHLGGTREQAARLTCGPWLRLIHVTEHRVTRPGSLDELDTDSLTGYAWSPRTGWDLDSETVSLACMSAEDMSA